MLCGPITSAIYSVASEELQCQLAPKQQEAAAAKAGTAASVASSSVGAGTLSTAGGEHLLVGRLAVQATRTQIQLLLDTVRTKNMELDALRREAEEEERQHKRKRPPRASSSQPRRKTVRVGVVALAGAGLSVAALELTPAPFFCT